ncbi:hypothetical protein [Nostoc sp.]|uniref:hypothetical protein n=1 Tax=Nostoc sp. TaxID=1180 RepID=UPI002FFD273E
MTENLLIDLCEPYLLDLIRFLAECMMLVEKNPREVADEGDYEFDSNVIARIYQLDYSQKAEVLAVAANHVKAIAEREEELITNDQ